MICDVASRGSHRRLLERAIINFQALGEQTIAQVDHTGACLKGLLLTSKLLLIEQITGEIG